MDFKNATNYVKMIGLYFEKLKSAFFRSKIGLCSQTMNDNSIKTLFILIKSSQRLAYSYPSIPRNNSQIITWRNTKSVVILLFPVIKL